MTRSHSFEPLEVLVVVRRFDVARFRRDRKRARLEPPQVVDRLQHVAVGIALLRRQLVENGGDVGVDEVRRDLRAHHAGAEHRGLAHDEWGSGWHETSDRWRSTAGMRVTEILAPTAAPFRRPAGEKKPGGCEPVRPARILLLRSRSGTGRSGCSRIRARCPRGCSSSRNLQWDAPRRTRRVHKLMVRVLHEKVRVAEVERGLLGHAVLRADGRPSCGLGPEAAVCDPCRERESGRTRRRSGTSTRRCDGNWPRPRSARCPPTRAAST